MKKFLKRISGIKRLEDEIARLRSQIKNIVTIGVDVNFTSQTRIIIISKIKDGYIKTIDLHFKSFLELQRYAEELKERYGTEDVIWDAPRRIRDLMREF